jgi:ferric-dicitrate binding protein FerR (iron transport regulator)
MAGPRQIPGAIDRDAARVAVRAAWREAIRARTRRRWMLIGAPALAAAAALVLATATWWQSNPPADTESILARVAIAGEQLQVRRASSTQSLAAGDVIYTGDVVETPSDAVAAFTLEGGGEIRQNGDTSLRWAAARQVALEEGHIYVDSGPARASVAVATSAGLVRDIGTRFDVRVRDGAVRIRVREGAVRLEAPATTRDAGAGYELVAGVRGNLEERQVATFGDDWDWILRATSFRLDRATLGAFIAWVEAESGRQVEFRPASLQNELAATVLRGSVAGLSMTQALETVLPAAGLTHRIIDGRIVIQRAAPGSRP